MAKEDQQAAISTSHEQQASVLDRALAIFDERNRLRLDVWAQFDEDDALFHIKSKLARLESLSGQMFYKNDDREGPGVREAFIDDALDIINYAVFAVRHAEGLKP